MNKALLLSIALGSAITMSTVNAVIDPMQFAITSSNPKAVSYLLGSKYKKGISAEQKALYIALAKEQVEKAQAKADRSWVSRLEPLDYGMLTASSFLFVGGLWGLIDFHKAWKESQAQQQPLNAQQPAQAAANVQLTAPKTDKKSDWKGWAPVLLGFGNFLKTGCDIRKSIKEKSKKDADTLQNTQTIVELLETVSVKA